MLIPEEFKHTELKDIRDPNFRKLLENYVKNMRSVYAQRMGLMIWGPPASGKGAAAAIIAKEARRRYKPGMFITIWELRESLVNKMLYTHGKTPMDRAKEVDMLVLDGLDDEDKTEKLFSLTDISRLVVSRAQKHKLTIITSRLSPRELDGDPKFEKFWAAIQNYVEPIQAPDPTDAQEARREQMRALLMGDDE